MILFSFTKIWRVSSLFALRFSGLSDSASKIRKAVFFKGQFGKPSILNIYVDSY
jgi:hypothetical protein